MSGEVAGVSIAGASGAVSGASVSLYLASRFGGQPAQGAAPPGGAADYGPITSGTAYGGQGAFTFTGVTGGDYYVLATYSAVNYWAGPISVVEDGDVVHKAGTETVTGAKTFTGGVTFSGAVSMGAGTLSVAVLTGALPVAAGGTGSATQNFVDLTAPQSVGGVKTFTAAPVLSGGLTVSGGSISLPNGSVPAAAIAGLGAGFVGLDLATSQIVTGQKTFDNDVPLVGGQLLGSAIATATAPSVTPAGTPGGTTYQYQVVARTYDGRDGIPSPTGQTTTGNAALGGANKNNLSWAPVTGAATYTILKFVAGTWQKIATGNVGTTYSDDGTGIPSAYTVVAVNPGGEVIVGGRAATFAGEIRSYMGRDAPQGWLPCDGSAVSRTTYAALFAVLAPAVGTFTVTIATPAVFTLTAHRLVTGDQVYLTATGALPTGLAANTLYWVIRLTADTFKLATSLANAVAGTSIATSGTQSGVHTLNWCANGLGNGSTTFNLPDLRGRVLAGADAMMGAGAASRLTLAQTQGAYGVVGAVGGEQGHQVTTAELASHTHVMTNSQAFARSNTSAGGYNTGQATPFLFSDGGVNTNNNAGSDAAHNNVQPTLVVNWIIAT